MIEDAIGYILGVCVRCILFLIYDKLNELNDSIKAKVDD